MKKLTTLSPKGDLPQNSPKGSEQREQRRRMIASDLLNSLNHSVQAEAPPPTVKDLQTP